MTYMKTVFQVIAVAILLISSIEQTFAVAQKSKTKKELLLFAGLTPQSTERVWLYKFLDGMAIDLAQRYLEKKYDKIKLASGPNANIRTLTKYLRSGEDEKRRVDFFLHIHGASPKFLSFPEVTDKKEKHDGYVGFSEFYHHFRYNRGKQKYGLFYTTACYGAHFIEAGVHAGFEVGIGARAINTNSLTEYPYFLSHWSQGKTAGATLDAAYKEWHKKFFDFVTSPFVSGETDSFKDIFGNKKLTVNTELY